MQLTAKGCPAGAASRSASCMGTSWPIHASHLHSLRCDRARRQAYHAKRRTAQHRAAAGTGFGPAPPPGARPRLETHEQLLSVLSTVDTFHQLSDFMRRRERQLQGPVVVYALLHAGNLAAGLAEAQEAARQSSMDQKPDTMAEMAAYAQLEQAEQLIEDLVSASLPHLPQLDLATLAAVALALARSESYTAEVFDIIAAAVVTGSASMAGSTTGSMAGSSGVATGAVGGLSSVPNEVLEPTVLSLACGFALAGHYHAKLFDEVVQAVIARPEAFLHMKALVNVSGAMLDVQHYAPQLLDAVGNAALQRMGEMDVADSVSLLLSLAFFRRAGHPWVAAGLGELVTRYQQQQQQQQQQRRWRRRRQQQQTWLAPREALLLYRAMVLLRSQGVAVPATVELALRHARDAYGPALLRSSGGVKNVDPEALAQAQQMIASGDGSALLEEMQQAGLFAVTEVMSSLSALGLEVARNVDSSDGMSSVDVCLRTGSRDVAVLVLEDSRYCHVPHGRLQGQPAVDILVLQALGWAVMPLPMHEWAQLEEAAAAAGTTLQQEQERYLRARLDAALS